jgi:hypothetical protein
MRKEAEILKRMGNKKGFTTLEESIKEWSPYILEVKRKGIVLPETERNRLLKQMTSK